MLSDRHGESANVWLVTASWREQQAICSGLAPIAPIHPLGRPLGRLHRVLLTHARLVVLHTGMGPRATHSILSECLEKVPCSVLLSIGYCGALQPEFKNSEILIYRECGLLEREDRVQRWIPGSDRLVNKLSLGLQSRGIDRRVVRGVTSEKIVAEPGEKMKLGNRFLAGAVDMETSVLFELAVESGLPCGSVRVVLDEAHHQLPQLDPIIDSEGKIRKGGLKTLLLTSPRRAQKLHQLERRARGALAQLSGEIGRIYNDPLWHE